MIGIKLGANSRNHLQIQDEFIIVDTRHKIVEFQPPDTKISTCPWHKNTELYWAESVEL
jgi:hypothetical protein